MDHTGRTAYLSHIDLQQFVIRVSALLTRLASHSSIQISRPSTNLKYRWAVVQIHPSPGANLHPACPRKILS
jgi:hypothetical protein